MKSIMFKTSVVVKKGDHSVVLFIEDLVPRIKSSKHRVNYGAFVENGIKKNKKIDILLNADDNLLVCLVRLKFDYKNY